MTASLVGSSGFAAIPTTAIDLPLVQRLQRSPRLWVRVLHRQAAFLTPTTAIGPGCKAHQRRIPSWQVLPSLTGHGGQDQPILCSRLTDIPRCDEPGNRRL